MKIEDFIEQLKEFTKTNPGIEIKVDTNSSWTTTKTLDPKVNMVNVEKTKSKFLVIGWFED